jgi:hypothetical protein
LRPPEDLAAHVGQSTVIGSRRGEEAQKADVLGVDLGTPQ